MLYFYSKEKIMVTIKDVAREAGVAISTVSNVINGVNVVSPDTKAHIEEVIKRLNYIPNLSGKFLKQAKTNVIGVFLTNVSGAFYSTVLHAMHAEATLLGYGLTIFLSNQAQPEDSYRSILGNNIDGAVVLNETITTEHMISLKNTKTPILFLDREVEDGNLRSVVIDNFEGIKQATRYFIDLGYQKIGYIHGHTTNYDEKERYAGYLSALAESKLYSQPEYELHGFYSEQGGYDAIRSFLSRKQELPDAFVCANDSTAIGAIRALRDTGFEVPSDINIIGFDNIEKGAYFSPSLSTVDSNLLELGKKAIRNLVNMIEDKEVSSEKTTTQLIIRQSCQTKC